MKNLDCNGTPDLDFAEKLQRTETKSGMISLSKNREFRLRVERETSEIDSLGFGAPPLKVRCMYLLRGRNWPQCENCSAPTKWVTSDCTKGWNKTCSHQCKTAMNNAIDAPLLKDKDWMYRARIDEQKSWAQIAKEVGCSEPTAQKWGEKHGIPFRRYNESNSEVMRKLRDKEWLRVAHIENHTELWKIAQEIGSSGATVSRWMQYHGLETNEPNSYDREVKPSGQCFALGNFVKSLGFDVVWNNRSILGSREIDIFIPEKNLAIEFNGLYHHCFRPYAASDAGKKGPEYHIDKTVRCLEKGISLIHIFSDQWEARPEAVKSFIRSKLGVLDRIYARKCKIIDVPVHVRRAFLNENHLQGDSAASICLGLEYESKLVAVMSFGKSRFRKDATWELLRFASADLTVVGGFSKLLNHFRKTHPGPIVSYADRTYSQGNVYKVNGFRLVGISKPQYWYVDPTFTKRHNRLEFVKKRIAPDDPRPEHEIMQDRGFHRIFGCGSLTFVLDS